MAKEKKLTLKEIKKGVWLGVTGAYVAEPTAGIYGLENDWIISSNDATSLYPSSEILSNIGYETLYGRLYDKGIIDNIIKLLYTIESNKDKGNIVFEQGSITFKNALITTIKNYTSVKSVANKKEFLEINTKLITTMFNKILNAIINENISLKDIFEPNSDKTYFLLKSNLFPLLESIQRMHQNNKGYNQIIIDWIFHDDLFDNKYNNSNFYFFENINSTKTKLRIFNINELKDLFKSFLLNPYGTLFYKHKEKTAYTVLENIKGMKTRRVVKNEMLCLSGLVDNFNKLDNEKNIFLSKKDQETFKLTDEEITKIYKKIDNGKDVSWRVKSLENCLFKSEFDEEKSLEKYLRTLTSQKDSSQNGIKTTLNTGYGITGMITYSYSNFLIANSITTCGKIYGIKTFQRAVTKVLEKD